MHICLVLFYFCILGQETIHTGSIQTGSPYQLPISDQAIMLDGALEETWQKALRLDLNFEVNPGENIPALVQTTVYLIHDHENLYVAFECTDPDPGQIRARYWDHDQAWEDDWVGIALDTFNDEKRAYEMIANPFGIQIDAINDGITNQYDTSWNAIWDTAGQITETGYIVEMAIPFNQIRFQKVKGKQVWGFDCFRRYPRTIHHHLALFPRDRDNPIYLSQTLKLEGLEGITPGKNMQLTPTLTYSNIEERTSIPNGSMEKTQSEAESGISGRWSISQNITMNGAINPDFSQIEADAIQLTINEQFALYFQETRPFFKEGSDYFSTPITLLHTRTIADPSLAIKTTGKQGAHTFGVFVAIDELTNLINPGVFGSRSASFDTKSTATVGRYRKDFGKNSTAGIMVTSREGGDYYNRVFAGDLNYKINKNDDISLHFASSQTAYNTEMQDVLGTSTGELRDHAIEVKFRHRKRSYSIWGTYKDFGKNFRSDLGFNPMTGFSMFRVGAEWKWYFDNLHKFTQVGLGGDIDQHKEEDGSLIEEEREIWAWAEGRYNSSFSMNVVQRTRVFSNIEFDQISWNHRGGIKPTPIVSFHYNIRQGDWIDFSQGRAASFNSFNPQVNFFLGKHVTISYQYSYYKMEVPEGELYTTQVQEMWLNYHYNHRLRLRGILQSADIERSQQLYAADVQTSQEDLHTQFLFSYKVNPQTVAYLGYSDNYYETELFDRVQLGRQIFAKLSYAWIK